MKYIVSSHVDYYRTTLPVLLTSLGAAQVSMDDVIVYVAGAERRNSGYLGSCRAHFVDHNSFEHTSLIEFAAQPEGDSAFMLHDTTEAGPNFGALSAGVARCEHAPADPSGWTNMGYFSTDFLRENADYLESLRNCSKRRAQMSERVFTRLADPCGSYGPRPPREMGQSKPYAGSPRLKVYYPELDLYKHMANHAGAGQHLSP